MRVRRAVDLSLAVHPDTQVYPGDPVVRFETAATIGADGFNLLRLHIGSRSGTNCDAPYHFDPAGARIDEVDPAPFAGPTVLIDVRGLPSLTKSFNIVTGIGAVTVPVASTIMVMDVFVLPRLLGLRRPLHRVATLQELAFANWPAVVALLAGTAVGAFTGGLVPGTSGFGKTYIGFPPLQAWVTGAVVYLVLVWIVSLATQKSQATKLLGYSRIEDEPAPSLSAAN
jgi:hypothetical protein